MTLGVLACGHLARRSRDGLDAAPHRHPGPGTGGRRDREGAWGAGRGRQAREVASLCGAARLREPAHRRGAARPRGEAWPGRGGAFRGVSCDHEAAWAAGTDRHLGHTAPGRGRRGSFPADDPVAAARRLRHGRLAPRPLNRLGSSEGRPFRSLPRLPGLPRLRESLARGHRRARRSGLRACTRSSGSAPEADRSAPGHRARHDRCRRAPFRAEPARHQGLAARPLPGTWRAPAAWRARALATPHRTPGDPRPSCGPPDPRTAGISRTPLSA